MGAPLCSRPSRKPLDAAPAAAAGASLASRRAARRPRQRFPRGRRALAAYPPRRASRRPPGRPRAVAPRSRAAGRRRARGGRPRRGASPRRSSPSRYGDDMLLADVALPGPARARVHVLRPATALAARAVAGARVVCPFGGRRIVGVVLAVRDGEPPKGAKPIAQRRRRAARDPGGLARVPARPRRATTSRPSARSCASRLPPVERETARELDEPTLFDRGARRRRAARCSG